MKSTKRLLRAPPTTRAKRNRAINEQKNPGQELSRIEQRPDNQSDENAFSSDEDEYEEPYCAGSEKPPKCAYLHPSFKNAETMRAEIPKKLLEIIDDAEHSDAGVLHMKETAERLEVIDYGPPMHIGLLGRTGAGKSSLLNSLLDAPRLAEESAAGGACTNVVTEFSAACNDQKTPLFARVQLYNEDMHEGMIRRILASYRKYYIDDLSEIDDEQELTDRRQMADTDFVTLRTLCCDHPQFRTDEVTHYTLKEAYRTSRHGEVYRTINEWVQQLYESLHSHNNICIINAATARELQKKLRRFIAPAVLRSDTRCKPSPWPLVKSISIHIGPKISQSPLLDRVVLTDLPGLADTNQVRIHTTKRHLRECDCILVVEEIFRAKDSESLDGNLRYVFSQDVVPVLVCTKIDELGNSSSESITSDETDPSILEDLTQIEEEIAEVREEFVETRLAYSRASAQRKPELRLKKECLERKEQSLKRKLIHAQILARNKCVSEVTQENYEKMTGATAKLEVFCASNLLYGKHREGFKKSEPPILTVDETSIPALRALLFRLSAAEMFTQLQHHCQAPMQDLLANVDLWTTQSHIDKQEHLSNLVSKPRTDCAAIIAAFCVNLKAAAGETVLDKITASEGRWSEIAVKLHDENWKEWHPSTYSAFIRREGTHGTARKERQSWNEAMLAAVVVDLDPCFVALEEKRRSLETSLVKDLNALFDTVCVELEVLNTQLPLSGFFGALKWKKEMVSKCVSTLAANLDERLNRMRLDAVVNDTLSYFTVSMSTIYDTCASETGKGCTDRKREKLSNYIRSSIPFKAIYYGLEKDLDLFTGAESKTLENQVVEIYQSMENDFENLFYREDMENEDAQNLRTELQTFLQWARTQLDGPIAEALAEAARIDAGASY